MTQHWPLAQLRLHTPELQLVIPTFDQLHQLAELAADGVHPDDQMPFGQPWSAAPPADRARSVLQWHWLSWAELDPEKWTLAFVVMRAGIVVGTQDLGAANFGAGRSVHTGSWLGQRFQGQGIGTQMRAAVLEFAFRGLEAMEATTSAFIDNAASQRVSEKLGYLDNGNDQHVIAGRPRRERRFLLPRERWHCPVEVSIDNLTPCLPMLGVH